MQSRHGLVIGIAAFAGLLLSGGAAHAQDPCRVDQVLSPGQRCTVDVPGLRDLPRDGGPAGAGAWHWVATR